MHSHQGNAICAKLQGNVLESLDDSSESEWNDWLDRYSADVILNPVYAADAEQWRANMNSVNPKYVLRNHLIQKAIEKAENGDYR